jgi:hypothetical protein
MTTPPGQPPGQNWFGPIPPSSPPPPPRYDPWPRRHPIWFSLIVASVLVVFVVAAVSSASPPSRPSHDQAAHRPNSHTTSGQASSPQSTRTASPAASVHPVAAPLPCHPHASTRRPRDRSTVRIQVTTAPHARVALTTALSAAGVGLEGHASAGGVRTFRLRVGDATPGVRVMVAIQVSRHNRIGRCKVLLRPRKVKPPRPTPAPTSAPAPTGCYPLTDSGNCYEPGEFCRDSDHGVSGVAGDGENIVCEDNDGWRWEPV